MTEKDKTKKVGDLKKLISMQELCKGLPDEFIHYMDYVKSLKFEENPNYNHLRNLMHTMAQKQNIICDNKWD